MIQTVATDRESRNEALRAANRRTAAVLASIAAVFFLAIIAKYWLLR